MINYFNILSVLPILFGVACVISPLLRKINVTIDPSKMAYGASSMGVLLTFFGIWQGLIGFDVMDTEGSIPALLEGLKLAFGSSIVGLLTSLIINLLFVRQDTDEEKALKNIESLIASLNKSMNDFTLNLAHANVEALSASIEKLVKGLDMGINNETQDAINKFKESIEMLREWQERYIEEIKLVTDAMDKNAIVTKASSEHLVRTNNVLAELKPVTETIAESIGWVQNALPSFRKKKEAKENIND